MGHSMGGKAVLLHALQNGYQAPHSPQSSKGVRCVVALDAAPCHYDTNHRYLFQAMEQMDLTRVQHRRDAEAYFKDLIPHAGERAFILRNLRIDEETRKAQWVPNLELLSREEKNVHGWPSGLTTERTFEGPSLFIGGNLSTRLTTPRHLDAVNAHFPKSLVVMVEAGHFVHHAAASDTIEHIIDYLTVELRLRQPENERNHSFKKVATGATIRAFGLEECDEIHEGFSAPL